MRDALARAAARIRAARARAEASPPADIAIVETLIAEMAQHASALGRLRAGAGGGRASTLPLDEKELEAILGADRVEAELEQSAGEIRDRAHDDPELADLRQKILKLLSNGNDDV